MFSWFSLDIIYYPVSAIMWVWYKAFAFVLGPSNFFAWALSVMFLVFTLRAILYKPFVRQIRTTRQMQELQPQIKALQKKYGKDRQRMALEMQKLQKEHGFNPILGCLPMLAQLPVFLGLYHVLMSFNRTQTGIGRLGLSVEENRSLGNYVFSATDVGHFLDANLFGAPLGATMIQQHGLEAFTEFNRWAVDRRRRADDDPGRHRDVLQQPGVGGPPESRGGGEPADRDDEQTGAVRLPARRRRRRPVPAAGHHHVLARQQHLDLRAAALRVRDDRERRRGQEARGAGTALHRTRRRPARSPRRGHARPQGEPSEITTSEGAEIDETARRRTAPSDGKATGASPGKTASGTGSGTHAPGATPRPGARPKKRKR